MDFQAVVTEWKGLVEPLSERIDELEEHKRECEENLDAERKKLKRLERKQGRIIAAVRESRARIEQLEAELKDDRKYAHDNAHFFRNYIAGLKFDLEAAGISQEVSNEILADQQRRFDEYRQMAEQADEDPEQPQLEDCEQLRLSGPSADEEKEQQ